MRAHECWSRNSVVHSAATKSRVGEEAGYAPSMRTVQTMPSRLYVVMVARIKAAINHIAFRPACATIDDQRDPVRSYA